MMEYISDNLNNVQNNNNIQKNELNNGSIDHKLQGALVKMIFQKILTIHISFKQQKYKNKNFKSFSKK